MNIIEVPTPESIIGTFRRFGVVGPVYKVLRVKEKLADGNVMMVVEIIETGEEADYRYTDILDDPKES